MQTKNIFACLKHSIYLKSELFFLKKKTFLFLPNVHHSFWKLEKILTLMIKKAKRTWIDKKWFNNPFEHIWLKNVFDLKNYGFWKCDFNKKLFIFML
jgi:hypothetical protein